MQQQIRFIGLMLVLTFLHSATAQARTSADVSAALNSSALRQGQDAMLAVVVDVHAGLHAQSHTPLDPTLIPFELTPDANTAVDFGSPVYPDGQIENYAALGKLSVYTGRAIVFVPLHVKSDAPPGNLTISGHVRFQACNEGTCFAPEHPAFTVSTSVVAADAPVTPANADLFASAPSASAATPATTQPAANSPPSTGAEMAAVTVGSGGTTATLFGHSLDLSKESLLTAALVAFMAGVIFNVVPCVLPVLPVKAVGFYEASQQSRARSILLGFTFSVGLVTLFAILGMVVVLSKTLFGHQINWGQQFSHAWFVWLVALVLGALGFGMLGAFTTSLPTSIYGLDFRHDTLSGNFLWGGLTAILSTPCTAPLFPAVLGLALTLPKVEGFFLVTMVGCGMASPYFLLSAFPEVARRFPRTGAFAELVKQMMGFLMLGSAAFFAGLELVGQPNQWWIVFAVVMWGLLFMVVRTTQIAKSTGALCTVTGIAVAIGGGALALTLNLTDAFAANSIVAANGIQWQPYSADALADARKSGNIVVVDFTADWCLNCKYVESTVYHDPKTLDAIKKLKVVMIKADLTHDGSPGQALLDALGGTGIPYTAIYLPGSPQPVGLASIYTTDTLLRILNGNSDQAQVSDAGIK